MIQFPVAYCLPNIISKSHRSQCFEMSIHLESLIDLLTLFLLEKSDPFSWNLIEVIST